MTSILLPPHFFDKLDPSYQKCILELEKELNETLWYDNGIKSEIIDKFSDKYLMPKEIWDKRIDLQSLDVSDDPKAEYKKIKEKALTHFYSKRKHPRYYWDSNRKLLKAKFYSSTITNSMEEKNFEDKIDQKYIEYCLTFPHWKLKDCFKEFDEISTSPIPKHVLKRYKKVKQLFDKIKLSMDNLEQWFLCLLESEDEEFIVHNVEYNLGTDLTNKKLWKLYIKYLKDGKKYHDMVIVYSKYCNFFLDDTEMLKEYQNLKNIVKVKAENVENRFYLVNKQSYNLQMCQKSLHYNIFPQTFTFPTIFIRYFLDTADPDILHNLYQTCKYFYRLHSKPLCHQFVVQKTNVAEKFIYKGHSLDISVKNFEPKIFKNFYITNCLKFAYIFPCHFNSLSNLISNLYRCDAKFLKIYSQHLTFNEFKFLVGHGNVKFLLLYNVKISYTDDSNILLEDIFILTPKLYHFNLRISYVNITPKTVEIISKLNFENQFDIFLISIALGEVDPYEFWEFLKKRVKKCSKIWIKFQNPNPIYFSNFVKIFAENSFCRDLKIE